MLPVLLVDFESLLDSSTDTDFLLHSHWIQVLYDLELDETRFN